MTEDIRLYMFDGGSITLPLRNHSMGQGAAGEMITNPIIWFAITHPLGNVVIDGGNAPEVAVDAKAHLGAITSHSTPHMTPEQAAVPSLVRAGIDPESIRWVVQSHLHFDHTGAVAMIDQLPNAEVLVTRTEWEWAQGPDPITAQAYCKADYVKDGIKWHMLEENEDGYDLFGDGTLICWRTPGHSPGHQSFEVNLPSGASFMLTVDAANALEHLHEQALPGFLVDAPATLRSVRRLRRLAWRRQATIVAGHDKDQWPTMTQAPEYYS
jgi:glyoxylase-like metal-dependent hydrolase (beta-lactamase superfamily II)